MKDDNLLDGVYDKKHKIGVTGSTFKHLADFKVRANDKLIVTCSGNSAYPPYQWYDADFVRIGDYYTDSGDASIKDVVLTDYHITAPEGSAFLCVNCFQSKQANASISILETADITEVINKIKSDIDNKDKPFVGKTAVFFGTSIPAGAIAFGDGVYSIPTYVGKLTGLDVINEAVGSSCARRGWTNKKTENDQYGWTGIPWQCVFRSMGSSLAEKEDLITNYTSKWANLIGGDFEGSSGDGSGTGKPTTLTDTMKAEIRGWSYENKLMPYLDGRKPMPDIFIFEHAHNDYGYSDPHYSGTATNESNLDMSEYADAMYFYIKKIFRANPQAKIIIVSHYDNSSAKGKAIFNAQKDLAENHGLWFCDVANNIGWTQRTVQTNGYWGSNKMWVNSGGTEQTITRRAMAMYDDLHPHSDASGNAIKREAEIIASYIKANITL